MPIKLHGYFTMMMVQLMHAWVCHHQLATSWSKHKQVADFDMSTKNVGLGNALEYLSWLKYWTIVILGSFWP